MTLNIISFSATNLLWLELSPTAFANIGWKFYLVFVCLSVCNAFVIYYFFPDTLGRPLEEIAQLFGDEMDVVDGSSHEAEVSDTDREGKIKHVEEAYF